MDKVLVTGATGLIGENLCKELIMNGLEPIVLSRRKGKLTKYRTFEWDLQKEYIEESLFEEKIDAIIHLAGAGIADKRWTKARKKTIIDSRVNGVKLLGKYIAKMPKENRPKHFISAAAIGIYGNAGTEWVDENSPINKDSDEFLVVSCVAWEAAAAICTDLGMRTALLRIGIVLAKEGGALAKMLPSYKMRVGAYFGNGQQYYSWVHWDDICQMFLFLLENKDLTGVFNGVSPNPVKNKDFASTIATALGHKALLLPVPEFALKLGMGEMAAIVTDSVRVAPKRLVESGYKFKYPTLEPALKEILMK